jgi:hypothetical protein
MRSFSHSRDFNFVYFLLCFQLAFADAIYLVDAIEGGKTVMEVCKPALESNYVTKVIHDCKRDSEESYCTLDSIDLCYAYI